MYTKKLRPFSFDEMIGQSSIIREMKERSKTLDFPEVMIFSGETGTGKTTLAHIISALLNDPDPIISPDGVRNPNPKSPSSEEVMNGTFRRDIYFYDASSMGKDDVLKLEETLSTLPMWDTNKVVIIDEAQELSKAGKGATLNLLEKKRNNVYLILCTMNIGSFEKAVQDRGQVYKFYPPHSAEMDVLLVNLVDKLKVPVPEEFLVDGIPLLSLSAEGSVRRAVQNLERCVKSKTFTVKEIEKEFGVMSNATLYSLIKRILTRDMSVMGDISRFGAKDFFYKAFTTLMDAYIYSVTNYVSADWKKRYISSIQQYNLPELLKVFEHVDNKLYFKENVFLYNLAKYMSWGKRQ